MSLGAQQERIRYLATFSKERRKAFPDVPTLQELRYKARADLGIDYHGIVGSPKLPQDIRQILEGAFRNAAKTKEVIEQIENLGSTYQYLSGEEFYEAIKNYHDKSVEYKDLFEKSK